MPENVSSTADDQPSIEKKAVPAAPTGLSVRITVARSTSVATVTKGLGIEDIQGLQAHGTRITQTTPADARHNDKPIVTTKETWRAGVNSIGLTVREVDDDALAGERTRELVKLSFGEQDPAMFQPPNGYQVSTEEIHEIPCTAPR